LTRKIALFGIIICALWMWVFFTLMVLSLVLAAMELKHGFTATVQLRLVEAGVCFSLCDWQARYTGKAIKQFETTYGNKPFKH
jgi:hypothetical protein